MPDRSQNIVLITGASGGLGLHLSRAWFNAGATVVMAARDDVKLAAAAAEFTNDPSRCLPILCDVTVQADVERLFAQVTERFGRLDVLVNCAGISARGTIAETPPDEFDRLWRLNVLGLVRCTQRALPLLRQSHGSVVNIGSLAGKVAPKYVGAYAATKHAVAAISQQLRLELETDGVHVLHVCPGPIRRDDDGERYQAQAGSLPDHARQPGAGARIKGLDPVRLSQMILRATHAQQRELIVPWKVRVLLAIAAFSPRWGDWLLRKSTGG